MKYSRMENAYYDDCATFGWPKSSYSYPDPQSTPCYFILEQTRPSALKTQEQKPVPLSAQCFLITAGFSSTVLSIVRLKSIHCLFSRSWWVVVLFEFCLRVSHSSIAIQKRYFGEWVLFRDRLTTSTVTRHQKPRWWEWQYWYTAG